MTVLRAASPQLTIEGFRPCELMSLNARMHWRSKAALTKHWRKWAWVLGTQVRRHSTHQTWPLWPGVVTVELPVPDNRRRDPHNYIATVKPIIDGLVDAGLWPDDTPEWVSVAEPRLIVRRDGLVRIVITPKSHGEPPVSPVQPQSPDPASVDTSDTETTKESK